MLCTGGACTNLLGLGDPVGFEHPGQGRHGQRGLAALRFAAPESGHGKPTAAGASARLRDRRPTD